MFEKSIPAVVSCSTALHTYLVTHYNIERCFSPWCLFDFKISELWHFHKGMLGCKVKIPQSKKDLASKRHGQNTTFFFRTVERKKKCSG